MFISVVQMPVFSEDSAVNVKLSELTEIGYENDGIEILYHYYYQPDTNKVTFTENDSVEFDRRDSSNTNFSAKVYREGKWAGVIDKDNDYTTVLPEGEWLLSSFAATTNSGEIRFVHRYVNPEIFLVKNSSNILHLLVGNADSDGMATAIYSEEDELYPFFSGLDIKVRKTVDKLEAGSFCIYVKGKNGEDYTDFFEYYDSPSTNVFWQRGKWLNSYFNCLGAIEDKEVKIYIKPKYDLLHVKASVVGGKGGSISSADTYYEADSTEEQTYTVTPDEGYEVDDIEVTGADGNPVTVNLDKSTGEFTIKPSDLRKADTTFNVAEIKVTFSKKHEAHCICGGTTDYDGHDAHTNIEWQSWRSADSLPTVAGNYYLKNDVTLPAGTYTLSDGVNICLNGYRITGESVNKTNIKVNGTLGITECSAAGTGFIGSLSLTESGSKLIMYSGRLLETFPVNINGGTQFTMTGNSENIGILSINNDADFTMSGNAVNGHTIKLIETDMDANIVFSDHAYGGYVNVKQPQYNAGFRMNGKAKIATLRSDSNSEEIRLTMEDDAEISNVGIDFLSLSLSGNAKLGSASSKYTIEDEKCVLKDKVQLIGTVTYNNSELTLQDNASVTGELIVTGSGSASRVVMKGNSAINGKLTCRDDSVSFEMRDNATIDTIDVGISTVYGTVTCTGEIMSGVFDQNGTVINNGKITSGIFYGTVSGNGTIEDSATVDVIFDTDGGSAVDTQKVLRGQKAVTPGYCKKDGYTLDGWYNGDIAYNFTEPVIEGFTLTAQWTANTYTVSFDSDGSTAVGDKTLGWNDKVLDGIETPTRSNGYAFNGWKYGDISVDADTTYADLVADDTIASITLTAQWLDIEKPTGEITLGENNWNSFLNGITFGLFFKETKTVTITAADNSGKTVKIEYLLSDKEMSLSELANSTFTVYTDTFSIASDNNYVIYVRLTDEAGNEEYISSDGFVIDKTAPVIEGYEDGQTVNICGSKLLTFIETNLDSVTVNGNPISLSMGKYATLSHSGSAQVVVATDKAGNTTTVTFNIASDHDFNFETQKCNHCGQNALVELTVDGVTKLYDSYASAMLVLSEEFETAEFKLLGDITESSVSYFSKGKLVFDLNGFTFNNGSGEFYVRKDVDMTITGGGTMNGQVYVMNGGTLTVDNANGRIKGLTQHSGTLKVLSGTVDTLTVVPAPGDTAVRRAELYGGYYGNIQVSFYNLTCADLLEHSHRFEGISYADAKKTEMSNVNVILCNHENIDENNICMGCDIHYEAAIERNGVTTRYETLTDALDVSEDGDTLKLLADIDEDVTVTSGTFTLDATGRTISGDLNVESGAKLTVNGGTINKNTVCAKGGKLTATGGTSFKGTIDCIGEGSFTFCGFEGAFTGAGSINVYYSVFKSTIKVSNEFYAISSSSENEITIDVDKNGKLGLIKGFYAGNIKSEGELNISDTNHSGIITAESGSKLEISRGKLNSVEINENVDVTLSGGSFGTIKVSGKQLIDCLEEEIMEGDGYAFVDKDGNVIDGRVNSATDVKIISDHVHDCIWDTMTHEKRCACGYVGEIDTESPVISGIEDGETYYGATDFTVTDDNDFTVSIDGVPVQSQLGVWTITPDNNKHTISVIDVAGNAVSISVTVLKIYDITLPSGEGYTVTGADTAGHGTEYEFTVSIADGYSRTKSYRVLVNGTEISRSAGDESNNIFRIDSVDSDMTITVEGVADITAPDVEIEIGADNFKAFMNTVTFGLFFKDTQIVTVTAKDGGSGIKTVEYLLSETVFNDPGSVTGEWITMTLENGKAQFSLEPDHKAYIYVRVTDKSGNIEIINSEGVVLYTDSEAITESVDFTMRDSNDVSFDVKLNGNTVSALYNGDTLIDSGNYTVSESGTVTLKNAYLNTLAAGEYTIRVAYNPMGESYKNGDEPAMTSVKLTVSKRTALIDHNMSDKKYYDGKPIPEPSYKTDSDGAVIFEYKLASADDLTYITAAPKNVGVYTIRITIPETDVYNAVSSTMTYEILAKEVTISGATVEASKTYDGTTDANITSAGTLSGVVDDDNVTIVPGKANYSDKNVGNGKTVTFTDFAISGNSVSNYKLVAQPVSVTADITAKEITISGVAVEASKAYDGTTDAKITDIGTLSENFDGESLTIAVGKASYSDKNVGTGKAVLFTDFALSGKDASNYTLSAQPESVTADITAREITIIGVTVEPSKVYDGTTEAKITTTGALNGVVDGEEIIVAVGSASYSDKNAGTGKTVTFTDFAIFGKDVSNYVLAAQPESVTADITAREVTISGATVEATKVYDGTTDAKITSEGTLSGVLDGDSVTIAIGKANYSDKNVGVGKTVTFTDFALSGNDAMNYTPAVQPESTTAGISAKVLTIADLRVKDKQYDGKNTAEIDGTPTLVGVADGDVLELVNGIPTFDIVSIGKNIPISFTTFRLSGDDVTVGNYTLTQPTGITANITEYTADGSEYRVNSNDWINTDFVITANDGWKLSLSKDIDGEWADTLTASDETDNGSLTFYVKNTATGAISEAVTELYKIDRTAPTGEVRLNKRMAFGEFISTVTFGMLFGNDVDVELTAADNASGVKSVMYFKSDKALSETEIRTVTDWTDKSDFSIEAKDADRVIVYVRIEDNAGNIAYISSDGMTFDTTAPAVTGVENGKTYYVTKKVTVDDGNLESVTLNGDPVGGEFTLAGDTDMTYVIRAVDKVGNMTEYTVHMKPISSVTDAIRDITADNVKSDDAGMISSVERQLLEIDSSEATDDEQNKLSEAAEKCEALKDRIAEVTDEGNRLDDGVNGYDIGKVTSDDIADIEKLIDDIDKLLDSDNLTDTQRDDLEDLRDKAKDMLDRITAAEDVADAEEIKAVDGITEDNVKLDDKDALEKAKKVLESAIRDFDGNYTAEERKDLDAKLETVKAALASIDNVEKAIELISRLPSLDNATLGDKSEVDLVKNMIAGLSENEKAMLGITATEKVDALEEKIRKLAENPVSPDTGYESDPISWAALLFISGGVVTGTAIINKKKKRSVR